MQTCENVNRNTEFVWKVLNLYGREKFHYMWEFENFVMQCDVVFESDDKQLMNREFCFMSHVKLRYITIGLFDKQPIIYRRYGID